MKIEEKITKLASQCVKCHACAPHCPTYVKSQHEGESARGRIALMHALASKQLPLTPSLTAHLDSCLYCRSCEAVCPSQVAYGELITLTHQLIAKQKPMSKCVDVVFRFPFLLKSVMVLLYFYQRFGITWLARKTKLLKLLKLERENNYLPSLKLPKLKRDYPATNFQQPVLLFTGCIGPYTQTNTLYAAIHVLNAWGCHVHIPKNQMCCGAFHMHGGSTHFAEISQKNVDKFCNQPILFLDSGCGMILKDYGVKVSDIPTFLLQHPSPSNLKIKPLFAKIAVHTPCSTKNSLKTGENVFALLSRIPGVELIPLETSTRCCGAAGLNMLTHPKMADELADDIITQLESIKPDRLVTSNLGCRLHLEAQLRMRKIKLKIQHPVELLEEQIK